MRDIITNKNYDNQFTPKWDRRLHFFFCGKVTKRNQVRERDKYNMWKTKKTMKIKKNKKYLNCYEIKQIT